MEESRQVAVSHDRFRKFKQCQVLLGLQTFACDLSAGSDQNSLSDENSLIAISTNVDSLIQQMVFSLRPITNQSAKYGYPLNIFSHWNGRLTIAQRFIA